MIKSVKALVCAALSVTALLAGCGSGDNSSAVPTRPQTTTAQATTAPAETVPPSTAAATSDSPEDDGRKYNFLAIKQKTEIIDTKLKSIISDNNYLGSVYLKIGNDLEFIHSTGASNEVEHKNNSIHTCYYTGSFTKQITAAAVLKLCEDGKLKLDDTIDKYFGSYKYGKKITVKNLLTMTSGIPSYVNNKDNLIPNPTLCNELESKIKKNNSDIENKSIITKWILSQKLLIEPDSDFLYSESDYYLLGDIIEKASGQPYTEYVKQKILRPLGMNSSGFTATKNLAAGYDDKGEGSKLMYGNVGYSSLGFISDISDTLKYIEGLLNESVINKDSLLEMHTAYKGNFGYGVYINGDRVSISSEIGAYSSKITYSTNESEIFTAYSNYASSDSGYLHSLFKKYLSEFYI